MPNDQKSGPPPKPRPRRVERRHHKAEALPREVRDELAKRFQAGETYDALVAWLQSKGHEIGRSSVHRWGAQFQRDLERLRTVREAMQTLVADVAGKPATELNEVAEQMAVQFLLELVLDLNRAGAGEGDEAAPDLAKRTKILSSAAHALANLGDSATGRERLKAAFAKQFAVQKEAVAGDAKKVLQAAGATKEAVSEVVDKILHLGG